MKHKVLDLFSGIGGFSLGLERTGGFETVAFCEIDKKAQLVLKKHWANVPIYEDIKGLTNERLKSDGILPTFITAGFPCTDISVAGKAEGIHGKQSGLFFEVVRLVRTIRPKFFILENVSALLARGLGTVLGEFSKIGYDCEWHCITASSIGGLHRRDRVWIMGYPRDAQRTRRWVSGRVAKRQSEPDMRSNYWEAVQIMDKRRFCKSKAWETESRLGRVSDGVSRGVDRLRQLGNTVVPQIPEMIGNAILEYEKDEQ